MEVMFGGDAARVSTSQSPFGADDNVFPRPSMEMVDEEEALKWAALEKLPTYVRLRKGILQTNADNSYEEVEVTKLSYAERQKLIDKFLRVTQEDNERLLLKLRERIDKVGIDLPKIEVRYQDLVVKAEVREGSRALPSLFNYTVNLLEEFLGCLHLVQTRKRPLTILNGVSGIIKPSRMILLLGPPSSGKTTLLLALAGKLGAGLEVSGQVTYNGHELTDFVPQRTSAYISQQDLQLGEMTVRETLDFCGRCQGVGSRYEMLVELLKREKEYGIIPDPELDVFMKAISVAGQENSIVTDYVIKILGLDICADTIIGDHMRRGVSGGQRKRVTTGEMLVGPAKALFMDDISTGLDSSTTYQIVKCLCQMVHVMDETMVVSLLQPSPETFELFDDVILLSEGQICYQGPRGLILDFFTTMGFKCPERKSVADFLQEVTSKKDQAQYWFRDSVPYKYVTVKEFADAFRSYHVGQSIQDELAVPYDKSRSHPAALSTTRYGLKKWELLKACLWREMLLIRRNSFIYKFKTCQIAVISIVAMSVFLRTNLHPRSISDGDLYMGALFYGLINVMFNGFADLGMVVARLPVFYKQRAQLLYPAWAFSIPAFIMRVPISLLESSIWVCLTYYMIGFSPEPARFFRQFLLLFFVSQMALGLFRFLGAVGRSPIMASTFGSFALMMVFVLGGFVIAKDDVPKWWVWASWTSPMMYGQNALAINEFLGSRWQKPNNDSSVDAPTIGKAVLTTRGMFTEDGWYWNSIGILIAFAVLFNCLFTLALSYLGPLGKPHAILPAEVPDEDDKEQATLLHQGDVESCNGHRDEKLNKKCAKHNSKDEMPACVSNMEASRLVVSSASGLTPKSKMVLPFEPLSITFENINYYVDMPPAMKEQGVAEDKLQLLRGLSGAFRPGVLTALMGVSGAGKTTLMDVLAGRKTGGYIEGAITISGFPKQQETFARISGYCEQNDIHSPNVTVYESLLYSAWLRLSKEVNKETRMRFVKDIMDVVELSPLKDALIGLPTVSGLSTEQRKRLTIAVELVANPSIIFMDEPTSGLDARAAAIVMRTVQNTVKTGRTVVCTIHQPSIDIFEAFDELLLMKRGGEVIYAGPLGRHSCKLIEYFEVIPGVPKIKDGYNPAAWMLDISSPAVETSLGIDFAKIYRNSPLFETNQALIKEASKPLPGAKELSFTTKYSQSFLGQCQACLWKQHWSYWRNPHYNVIRLLFTTGISLVFGSIFWGLGSKTGTVQDLNNLMGVLYAMIFFLGVANANAIVPIVSIERTVFYRERAAGMYSAIPYAIAQVVIEVPYVLVETLLYAVIIFAMLKLPWEAAKFFYFTFFMFFCFFYFTCYGMMVVVITPSQYFAAIISSGVYGLWNLFSGFMIPRTRIPVWWRWYFWADPIAWTLYGLIGSQFGDLDTRMVEVPGQGFEAVSEYVRRVYGYHYEFLGVVAAVHITFTLLFVLVFALCIKKLNFQKR